MKIRKAGGKSDVLPELILHGGVDLWDRMLEVMRKVWEEGKVVRDWQDAVVVPIPKKGDLKQRDHWCGISLLDVVGKVIGRNVQGRLQVIAEKILYSTPWCSIRIRPIAYQISLNSNTLYQTNFH